MEYLWLYFVLVAVVLKGFQSTINKFIAAENLNFKFILLLSNFFSVVCTFILILFFGNFENIFNVNGVLVGSLAGLIFYLVAYLANYSLKNVSASIFFINKRIFSTILIFISSYFIFSETLLLREIIGIFFGFIVFLLLVDFKEKVREGANLKKGIFILIVYIFLLSIGQLLHKFVDIEFQKEYLFFVFLSSLFFVFVDSVKNKNMGKENFKSKKLLAISFIFGIFNLLTLFFYIEAINLKEIAIVYKVYSFEIFIPIIFSIFYYKEKVTWRKIFAFILTIISILFFL